MGRRQTTKESGPGAESPDASRASAEAALAAGIQKQFDKLRASPLAPGLYLVSTPIGNLADMSVRALHALASASVVICEDTRHSRKLFSAYGVHRKLEAYHDFSGEKDRDRIMAALAGGKSVALISDAGTPLIADPGFKLVRSAIGAGHSVFAVPGPSAILAALVASGLPSDRFFFGGFLPPKDAARRDTLEKSRAVPGTLIFYETAPRLEGALKALGAVFPDRDIAVAREITKLHEGFVRGPAAKLLEEMRARPPLGELVLLIGPGRDAPPGQGDIEKALRLAMSTESLKEAVEEVSKALGVGRKTVYNLALKMKGSKI